MSFKHVCVIGLGYIGLPTAAVIAQQGMKVTGVDTSSQIVDKVNSGGIHIAEQDLDCLVHEVVKNGFLSASLTPVEADVFIIAVPTPFKKNHKPDLNHIESAAQAIIPFLKSDSLIILESTSPVGTTEQLEQWLYEARPDLKATKSLSLAYCPERVLPGKILQELVENDRIVGGVNEAASLKAQAFYRKFCQGEILVTDARTAEMTKLSENAFRDVSIAFANELANICDTLNINVWELIRLANHHPRVNILQPGPGVGGHCIAVDPWFIVDSAPNEAQLIRTARQINDARPEKVVNAILKVLETNPQASIACLGLAFKPNVGDLRESPAMTIVKSLAKRVNNSIAVAEPFITELPPQLQSYLNVQWMDFAAAINSSQIVVVLVNHDEFLLVDPAVLKQKIVIDTRGCYQKHFNVWKELGDEHGNTERIDVS